MPIVIDPIESKAALEEFVRLPARLYKGFPKYVPPLTMERRGFLDPEKAPFFKHGKAKYWIARRDGKAVGRISAQIDNLQPDDAGKGTGLFGCLDTIDDGEVVRALLDTAEAWLRQQGKERSFGPCLLSMNEEPGLLVSGHDEPPLIMAPWHPPYLARALEACGYAACRDLHYWRLDNFAEKLPAVRQRKRVSAAPANLTVRPLDLRNLARDVEIIRNVYNDAWKDNWGFVPIAREDLEGISRDMKPFIKPEFGMIAEKAGKPVGVAMALPNLFEITGDLGADPSLIGWGKLAYRTFFHRFRTGRIILLGVLSELRHSVGGAVIAMTMVDEIVNRLLSYEHQAGWLEAGWVLDNNRPLQKILRQFGFEITRTLRLYDKEFRSD